MKFKTNSLMFDYGLKPLRTIVFTKGLLCETGDLPVIKKKIANAAV